MNETAHEVTVANELARLAERARDNHQLAHQGRLLDVRCLIGSFVSPVLFSIRNGAIVETNRNASPLLSWDFAFRAHAHAWIEFWQPMPKPGCHDLLALTKSRQATLEGNLHPFMSRLQFFKDLLALPRGQVDSIK